MTPPVCRNVFQRSLPRCSFIEADFTLLVVGVEGVLIHSEKNMRSLTRILLTSFVFAALAVGCNKPATQAPEDDNTAKPADNTGKPGDAAPGKPGSKKPKLEQPPIPPPPP
jgi:hypothetical protein